MHRWLDHSNIWHYMTLISILGVIFIACWAGIWWLYGAGWNVIYRLLGWPPPFNQDDFVEPWGQ